MVVAGKGGVGSSTVAAAAALAAAPRRRRRAVHLGRRSTGNGPIARRPGDQRPGADLPAPRRAAARSVRRTIPADQAFGDYLETERGRRPVAQAASSASLPMIAAATPGLEHLLVLGKVKELEKQRNADLIVVDAPPAGHAGPFLRSASGLSDVVKSGPILDQAQRGVRDVRRPGTIPALLVGLPEETPITEMIELANDLGDDLGIVTAAAHRQRLLAGAGGAREVTGDGSPFAQTQAHRLAKASLESAVSVRSQSAGSAARATRAAAVRARREPIITLPRLATPTDRTRPPRLARRRPCAATTRDDRPSRHDDQQTTSTDASVADVVRTSELILTCGPGGVGKTTTAAALGCRRSTCGPTNGRGRPSTRRGVSPTRSASTNRSRPPTNRTGSRA